MIDEKKKTTRYKPKEEDIIKLLKFEKELEKDKKNNNTNE